MRIILENIVKNEASKYQLKERMTGVLVKKKKRGTYQALEECTKEENDIVNSILDYLNNWLIKEIMNGEVYKLLIRELKTQLIVELSRKGYDTIIQDIV